MSAFLTRRRLIQSIAATAALSMIPHRAAAQGIGVVEAIGVAISVFDAINKAKGSSALKASLRKINRQLDILIVGQQRILDEIANLRLFISEALFLEFRRSKEFELNALKDSYDFVAPEGRIRNRAEATQLAADVQIATNELGQYDFGAFYNFTLGASMALVLRRLLNTPEDQMKLLKAGFRGKVDQWLMPGNPIGILQALAIARNDTDSAKVQLDAYPRRHLISEQWRNKRGNTDCRYRTYLILTGDLTTPFTGTTTTTEDQCHTVREPGDGCKRCLSNKSAQSGAFLAFDGAILDAPDYSTIPALASATESPYGQINEANRLRNIVINSLRHEQDLIWLKGKIEGFRDQLAA